MHRPLRLFSEMSVFQKELILLRNNSKLSSCRNIGKSINRVCWVCGSTTKLKYVAYRILFVSLKSLLSLYRRYYFYNSTLEVELLNHESRWRTFFMILKNSESDLSKSLRKVLKICAKCLNHFKCHVSKAYIKASKD